MTRIHILFLSALGVAFCACEMHPASQLPEHLRGGDGHAPAATPEPKTASAAPLDAKPAGEAPKFFPETK